MIKKTLFLLTFLLISTNLYASPDEKSKFYAFSEQLIDGEIQRPTAIYMDSRQEAKFQRLLKLKRDFLGDNLWRTARDRVFK